MTYSIAVVRKNSDGNFVVIFPTEEAYGDTCRAFIPAKKLVPINDLECHKLDYISRGTYLQTTEAVGQEEADRILKLYSANHCAAKTLYRAADKWERS